MSERAFLMASGSLPSTQPAPKVEPSPQPSPPDAQVCRGGLCALVLTPTFLVQGWAKREGSSPKLHGWPFGLDRPALRMVF